MITGFAAYTARDDGTVIDPLTASEWDAWVSASRTRNHLLDDPLLDWLARHGRSKGYQSDEEVDGFDPRTDFLAYILARGLVFEERVIALLERSIPIVRIGSGREDAQDLAKARTTFEAMVDGAPMIHQAVLRNPQDRTYGAVDLLVRSDHLDRLAPGTLLPEEAVLNAPALGGQPWHYRVVDVKFTTLRLRRDGHATIDHLKSMAQVWVYNEALGRIQGLTPAASYLLGRGWAGSGERGTSCFERLARVDHDHRVTKDGPTLAARVADAVAWVRRMRSDGAGWDVLPVPTVPELYPHARSGLDQPWHRAKWSIATQLAELTMLPGMNPERRRAAHATGLTRWDDAHVTAEGLGLTGEAATACDAVLAANRARAPHAVLPERITRTALEWRTPAALELFVDFETVSNLADDFATLPESGGQSLIFQIGCGWYDDDGAWRFWQATADRLDQSSEARMIEAWVERIRTLADARGVGPTEVRVVHWSPAESAIFDTAYNAARVRHVGASWPDIPWFDALALVVKEEPVTVRGAFGFGLKAIAKAMQAAGLIETTWGDGPTDGLGAMVGAWWCDAEAARLGGTMAELPLMAEVGRYNEVDCRTMAEVVRWLRSNR